MGDVLRWHNAIPMKIALNSDEFKAWHKVGHATVCLHFGGNLDGIEFLEEDARGFAVAHCCDVMPDMEGSVACGGFAAQFCLLQAGYVDWIDLQEISAIVFVALGATDRISLGVPLLRTMISRKKKTKSSCSMQYSSLLRF